MVFVWRVVFVLGVGLITEVVLLLRWSYFWVGLCFGSGLALGWSLFFGLVLLLNMLKWSYFSGGLISGAVLFLG